MEKPDLKWAKRQITKFLFLAGAPTDEEQLELHAAALLRIVADNAEQDHPLIGKVRPGDYTIQAVYDSALGRFPAPILFRRVYSKFWRPADGKFASELEAVLNAQE